MASTAGVQPVIAYSDEYLYSRLSTITLHVVTDFLTFVQQAEFMAMHAVQVFL